MKLTAVFLLALLSIGSTVRAQAQALPVPLGTSDSSNSANRGILTTADVELNGVLLFRVAAPADVKLGEISAAYRALMVEESLQQLVATDRNGTPVYDASTLRVLPRRSGEVVSIVAMDARHAVPLPIVTVTLADLKYQQLTADAIAASWQLVLQSTLVQTILKLQPTVERRHLNEIAEIAAALGMWTVIVLVLSRTWRRRSETLERPLEEESPTLDYDAALRRSHMLHNLRVLSAASGVLFWFTVLAWFITVTWAFAQFAQTTALSQDLSHGATTIVIIWITAAVLNQLCDLAIARVAASWRIHNYRSSEQQARVLRRIPTASGAVGHFKTIALILIAGFFTLSQIGLPVNSAVTIGGIAALAMTFSAQNVLKDVVGGIAVLYEDQYAIGDQVTINGHTGIVENVTLRCVRILDEDGSAVTISHGAVT
ncbi:MAG TPA: mechanosensitive ion channel domain-containing protein, partial [Candidatus Baltobacteraceae bacterium]|nr:mechanosensitive ion channel domain-containing protein [Candidatus Baltobacteraceae bacterium]